MFKLYISPRFNLIFSSSLVLMLWLKFGENKTQLVRVRTPKCFGLKYRQEMSRCLVKNIWSCRQNTATDVQSDILFMCRPGTTGKCPEVSSKSSSGLTFTNVKMLTQITVTSLPAFSPVTLPSSPNPDMIWHVLWKCQYKASPMYKYKSNISVCRNITCIFFSGCSPPRTVFTIIPLIVVFDYIPLIISL